MRFIEEDIPEYTCLDCGHEFDVHLFWGDYECPKCKSKNFQDTEEYRRGVALNDKENL